jgi:hypothetical protein
MNPTKWWSALIGAVEGKGGLEGGAAHRVRSAALAQACRDGDEGKARKLLAAGAGGGLCEGKPDWEWAARTMPDVFVETAKRSALVALGGLTPLMWAAQEGQVAWVRELMEPAWSDDMSEALRVCCAHGMSRQEEVALLLLANAPSEMGRQAVSWAVGSKNPALVAAVAGVEHLRSVDAVVDHWAIQAIRDDTKGRWAKLWLWRDAYESPGSFAMLQAVLGAGPAQATPAALRRLARCEHAVDDAGELMEAARLLGSPETMRAVQASHAQGGDSPISSALEKGQVELARLLKELGAPLGPHDAPLANALISGDAEAAAWALALEVEWPERLQERLMGALSKAGGIEGDQGFQSVLRAAARLCDMAALTELAVTALAEGNQGLAKALLPLCDMEEAGVLALGKLASAKDAEFGVFALGLARSMAQRQALERSASSAPCLGAKSAPRL